MTCIVSSFVQWLDGVSGSLQSQWHLRFITWILMSFARAPNTSQSCVCSMLSWNGLWLIWGYLSTCFGRDSAESDAWIAFTSFSDHRMVICSSVLIWSSKLLVAIGRVIILYNFTLGCFELYSCCRKRKQHDIHSLYQTVNLLVDSPFAHCSWWSLPKGNP